MTYLEVKDLFAAYTEDCKKVAFYQTISGLKFRKDLTIDEEVKLTTKQEEIYIKLSQEAPQILKRREAIEVMILSLSSEEWRIMLTDRYINGLPWYMIADKYNYSLSNIFKLHSKALQEIAHTYTEEGIIAS